MTPSAVTCRSCIASSSAAWVLAGARLISSASRRFANIGPGRNVNVCVRWSSSVAPVMSDGQQVGGELDAPERQARGCRERARHQGLGDAGQVVEQDVAVGEEAHQHELEDVALADDRPLDLVEHRRARSAALSPVSESLTMPPGRRGARTTLRGSLGARRARSPARPRLRARHAAGCARSGGSAPAVRERG